MSTKHEKNAIRGTKVSGEVFHLTLEVECEKKTNWWAGKHLHANLEMQKVSVADVHTKSFQFRELTGHYENQVVDKIRSY